MLVLLSKARKDKDVRKNNMSKYNLHDLFEGMSDKEFADAQEKERLEDHPERDKIKAIQALLAKEKGMKEDLLSKDGDNEDNVDNVDQVASPSAKGTGYKAAVDSERSESGKEQSDITQTTKPMYKENKVPSLEEVYNIDRKGNEKPDTDGSDASKYKKAARDMKENKALGYLDKEVSDRIEGMLNIPMKKKFMDIGMDLIQDLLEEDPFDIDDIITHLANELGAYLDSFYAQGDRLNSIPMEENGDVKDYAEEIKEASAEESIADYIIDYYTNPKTGEKIIDDDIVMAYFKTHPDYMDRFDGTPEGMKDGLDDFQEFLFVNYDIPGAGEIDEAKKMEDLKEHFNRFK